MEKTLNQYIDDHQSFFLYAGAGSGKTHALVELLKYIRSTKGTELERKYGKVAVITYTNAATDEIKRRIGFDELFEISTIHSFVWSVICPFQRDIKRLYTEGIRSRIEELETKQSAAKNKTTKQYLANEEKLGKYRERLEAIAASHEFVYNPTGNNLEPNSLNHSDVIEIGSKLLGESKLLQRIVTQHYPIIFIDESQDTNKKVMMALLQMEHNFKGRLLMGLFGDVKQRIYMDGVQNIEQYTNEWGHPVLRTNFRSAKNIVSIANLIAKEIQEEDKSHQEALPNAEMGHKRMFVIRNTGGLDKDQIESNVAEAMAKAAEDDEWRDATKVKILTLEHRMAATRMGFTDLFDILNDGQYKDDFLKGELSETKIFLQAIFPILVAEQRGNKAASAEIMRQHSPLLACRENLTIALMKEIGAKVDELVKLLTNEKTTIGEALTNIVKSQLFPIHDVLKACVNQQFCDNYAIDDESKKKVETWKSTLDISFRQLYCYFEYVTECSRFATHQGVKGLEYDRVMVIYDDSDARGHTFSYEKVFGVVPLSEADKKNKLEGKETTVDRTLRLLYVTCTRAKKSLALVVYSQSPDVVKKFCSEKGWFTDDEIITM